MHEDDLCSYKMTCASVGASAYSCFSGDDRDCSKGSTPEMHGSGNTKNLGAGRSVGLGKRRFNGVEEPKWLKLLKRPGLGLSPRKSQKGYGMETRKTELDKSRKESKQDAEKCGRTENGRVGACVNGSARQRLHAHAYRRWLSSRAGISNMLGKKNSSSHEDTTGENAPSDINEVVAESCLVCSNKRQRVELDYKQQNCYCNSRAGHDLHDISLSNEGKANLSRLEDLPSGCLPGAYKDYLIYVDKLLHRWKKGQNTIVVDDQLDQERVAKVVLFVLSLQHVVQRPFLIVSTSCGLSVWEAGFLHLAPSANLVVYKGSKNARSSIRSLKFCDDEGQIMFQVLLSCSNVVAEDVEVLKYIEWKAIIIDECQRSCVSRHFEHFKSLATDMRLLLVSTQIKDCAADYLTMLSLLDLRLEDGIDTDICQLKERLKAYMAYECKSHVLGFTEYWVPVWLSNVQLEQYCDILLSNYAVLGSVSKNEPPDTLREIVMSTRKCCDHPYLLDWSLQGIILNDSPLEEHLNVEVQVSGKLLLVDKMLSEIKSHGLRALIIFQALGRSGKDSAGDILEDFVSQRFGWDCYVRIDGIGGVYARSKKLAALNKFNNKDSGKFVFLIDSRACLPSIKLCSVDTVILFDSDWDPQNDMRAMRRIAINSQFKQLTVFRLYTCFTSEEMVLILAKKGTTVDHTIDSMNRIACNTLLSWGVSHLFQKLDDLSGCMTSIAGSNLFSEWSRLDGVLCELLALLPFNNKPIHSDVSYISKVEQSEGAYVRNISLLGEKEIDSTETDDPLLFWKYVLEARHPQWYFLPESSPRFRRKLTFLNSFQKESKLENNVGSCKGFNKQLDPVHLKSRSKCRRRALAADKEYRVTDKESSSNQINRPSAMHPMVVDFTGSPKADKVVAEAQNILPILQNNSLSSLKLEIRQLCDILQLPDNVKDTAVALLKYIMDDYNVSWKTISTFQAFQISLCWMAADFLKHEIDHKASLIRARLKLKFECKVQEANYISSKLQNIKKPFALHLGSVEKVEASNHVKNSKATSSELEDLGGEIQINTNDVQTTSCNEQDSEAEQMQTGFESQNLPHDLEDLEEGEIPPRSCCSKGSKVTVPDLQDFEEGERPVGSQVKTISGESVDLEERGMPERFQSPNLSDLMVPLITEQKPGSRIGDNFKEKTNDIIVIDSDTRKDYMEVAASKGVEVTCIDQSNGVKSSTSGIKDGVPVSSPLERQIPVGNINMNDAVARPSEVSQTQSHEAFMVDELRETLTHGAATKDKGITLERENASEIKQSSQEATAAAPFAGESFDLEFTETDSAMLQQDNSTIQGDSNGLQQMPVCSFPSSGVQELLSMPTFSGMQCFQYNERSAFTQEVCVSGQQYQTLLFNPPGSGTYLPCPTAMPAGTRAQDCRSIAAASGCYADTGTPDIPQLSSLDPLQIEIERLRKNDEQDLKTHKEMILCIKAKHNGEMEKLCEKYDVLLEDAEIALMRRRNERKANILKVYANMLLAEACKIDLKAVSSGTRKGLINELINPSIQRTAHLAALRPEQIFSSPTLASLMEVFNRSTTLSTAVSPMTSFTNNPQGGIHLQASAPPLQASRSQPPVLPSYLPAIYNSLLNQQFSSSPTIASAVGTNPAPRQLAGSHHTHLPRDVDGLHLPIYHGVYRNTFK